MEITKIFFQNNVISYCCKSPLSLVTIRRVFWMSWSDKQEEFGYKNNDQNLTVYYTKNGNHQVKIIRRDVRNHLYKVNHFFRLNIVELVTLNYVKIDTRGKGLQRTDIFCRQKNRLVQMKIIGSWVFPDVKSQVQGTSSLKDVIFCDLVFMSLLFLCF